MPDAKKKGGNFERSPLQSKKFLAFLLADMGWKVITIMMLFTIGSDMNILAWGLIMAVIITAGFIQTGMILGQAHLDKYVRIATINAGLGMGTALKKAIPAASEEDESSTE